MSYLFKKFFTILIMVFLVGCGSSDSTETGSSTKDITISHLEGVDFSQNSTNPEWEEQDGYAIFWSPSYVYISGEESGSGVWYSNNVSDETFTYIYIQSLGNVSLDSVTSVDTTAWPSNTSAIKSLQVGDVYIVKARDGYAKFKVKSINTDNLNFTAEYAYSSTTTF